MIKNKEEKDEKIENKIKKGREEKDIMKSQHDW